MKPFFFFLLLAIFSFSSCGFYVNYTKINSVRGNQKPFSVFQSKKVFLLKLNLPHSYSEQNLALPLILREAFLSKFIQNKAVIVYGKKPLNNSESTELLKKDPFNWFFKSTAFHKEKLTETIKDMDSDYFVNVNVTDWQPGINLESSWIEFSIEIFDSQTQKLVDLIKGKGFYHSLFEK